MINLDLDFERISENLKKVTIKPGICLSLEQAYLHGAKSPGGPCTVCRNKVPSVRTHFHGSELNQCARRVYLDIIDSDTYAEPSNEAFLLDGHTHEALILKALEKGIQKTGLPFLVDIARNKAEISYNITGDIKIIGHFDGILHDRATQTSYVLECKAVKETTWREVVSEGKISEVWYGQMQFYMLALDIPRAILCIKNRVTSAAEFKLFEFDEEFCFTRFRKLIEIYTAVTKGTNGMPNRERPRRTHKDCSYCPHKEDCWDE